MRKCFSKFIDSPAGEVCRLFWSLWSVTCLQTLANLISYDILHHDKDDEKHLLPLEVKSVQFGNESLTSRVKKRGCYSLKRLSR